MRNALTVVKTLPQPKSAEPEQYVPLTAEIIKAIASDIGKDTAAYISVMYPEAVKASSSTFLLSLRNHIFNEIMASVKYNDAGEIRVRLEERRKWRREWLAQWRKIRKARK